MNSGPTSKSPPADFIQRAMPLGSVAERPQVHEAKIPQRRGDAEVGGPCLRVSASQRAILHQPMSRRPTLRRSRAWREPGIQKLLTRGSGGADARLTPAATPCNGRRGLRTDHPAGRLPGPRADCEGVCRHPSPCAGRNPILNPKGTQRPGKPATAITRDPWGSGKALRKSITCPSLLAPRRPSSP
jgi:hypothetical protein